MQHLWSLNTDVICVTQSDSLAHPGQGTVEMNHNMGTYDMMEAMRLTNQWLGATAQAFGSYPMIGLGPNPILNTLAAWGEVTERSFQRMVAKPDWDIASVPMADGKDHIVTIEKIVEKPFGDLIQFAVSGRKLIKGRKVLLVAPMSGHFATLLRGTVRTFLPDSEGIYFEGQEPAALPPPKSCPS